MKKYLDANIDYYELDICGEPDLLINLERELPIPVQDNSYDTVVCTDVLEHLDNLHDVFEELLRVTNKYIIISLPNSMETVLSYYRDIEYAQGTNDTRSQNGKYMKFYGLPFENPNDRHKWFFSYIEAEEFFEYKAKKLNFKIKEMFPIGYYVNKNSYKSKLFRYFIKIFASKNTAKNVFPSTFWIVIEK